MRALCSQTGNGIGGSFVFVHNGLSIQFPHKWFLIEVVFFEEGSDLTIRELLDPVGLLKIPILDGDEEIECLVDPIEFKARQGH